MPNEVQGEKTIIPFGCMKIDELFDGGLKSGELTLVYGDYGAGKTLLCFMITLKCLEKGYKVIYVTTEKPFAIERLVQLAEKTVLDGMKKEILKNLIVITPENFSEQTEIVYRLELFITQKVKLVIFDSITERYREVLSGKKTSIWANKVLNEQMALLKYIASSKEILIIVTGHITDVLGSNSRIGKDVVASKVIKYWCDNIIRLERKNGERILTIEVKRRTDKNISIRFKITSEGISYGYN